MNLLHLLLVIIVQKSGNLATLYQLILISTIALQHRNARLSHDLDKMLIITHLLIKIRN